MGCGWGPKPPPAIVITIEWLKTPQWPIGSSRHQPLPLLLCWVLSFLILLMIRPKPAWAVKPRSIFIVPWLALVLHCDQQCKAVGQKAFGTLLQCCPFFNVDLGTTKEAENKSKPPLAGVHLSDTGLVKALSPVGSLGLPGDNYFI